MELDWSFSGFRLPQYTFDKKTNAHKKTDEDKKYYSLGAFAYQESAGDRRYSSLGPPIKSE